MNQTNHHKGDQRCSNSQLGPSSYSMKAQPQDLINRLPDDCIFDIFKLLDVPKDLESCATVCWRWAELVLSLASKPFQTWKKNHLVLKGHDLDDTQLVLKAISISCRDTVSKLDIIQLSSGTAANLGVRHVTDKGLEFATKAFRNLSSVRLIGCPMITDDGILQVSTRCTAFSSLHIEDCPSITVASLQTLVEHAKKLSFLSLGHCPQILNSAIVSLMTEKPSLANVELHSMDVLPQSAGSEVATIISLPIVSVPAHRESQIIHHLRTLFLVDCSVGYLQGLLPHFELQFLKCLVIGGCTGMNHLDLIHLLGPKTRLKRLDLAMFRFSSYACLMEVLYSCQETIQELTLDDCTFDEVSQPRQDAIPQACPQMQMIEVSNCASIAYLFLPWLAQACSELLEISLVRMTNVATIRSNFFEIIYCCKMITKMDLSWAGGNNYVADCVILQLGDTLRELVLDGWVEFTGNLQEPLARRCHNLAKLSLRYTTIDDDALRFLMSEKLQFLEEIVLEGTLITDEALQILLCSRLPRLRKLNTQHCACITSFAATMQDFFERSRTEGSES